MRTARRSRHVCNAQFPKRRYDALLEYELSRFGKSMVRINGLNQQYNGTEEITKTEYTDAFKPCPFCGFDELVITGGFFVRCLDCDAQSGVQYSEAHAVKEWNVRNDKKGEKQ